MMLVDHRIRAERDAQERNQQSRARCAYGDFIAQLAPWNWFATITFRDTPSIIGRESGPPSAARAFRHVNIFLQTIQRHAPGAGWVLVQESGSYGRLHFHFLLTGVGHLDIKAWEHEANVLFGDALFLEYDEDGAAHYLAKELMSEIEGGIWFGGTLAGVRLSEKLPNNRGCGRSVTAHSASLPREFFHMSLGRWHR